MTTNTELANSALALLGEMPITAIGDTTSKPARICNLFADSSRTEVLRLTYQTESTALSALDVLTLEAVVCRLAARIVLPLVGSQEIQGKMESLFAMRLQEAKLRVLHTSALNGKILAMIGADLAKMDLSPSMLTEFSTTYADEALTEVLRMGRWNCAIKRGTLTAGTAPAMGEYAYAYALPATCLRVLEVNGESTQDSDEFFEIEGTSLLSNAATAWIRYVDKILLAACDPALREAINARHAAKIAAAMTLPSAPALEGLFQKRLAEARQHDAAENGGAEKPGWSRVFGRSRLLGVHSARRNPLRLEDY